MEDNDRFVDKLLDSALSHHRDAEPRVGLEGRILAHVRAACQESSKEKARKLWLAVAATTAAVVVFGAIYTANRTTRSVPQTPQASNAAPAPAPRETLKARAEPVPAAGAATAAIEPKRIARHERKPSRRVEAHHWPSQFPTPAPLTPEEKALVRYVQETPPQVLAEPFFKEQATLRPIEIKPLEIKPLKIKPLGLGTRGEEVQ